MEYNGVVREFFPEGAPVLLQGFYFDDDAIEPEACKMFPIIDGKILKEPPCEDKADEIFVRRRIARRLNKILSYDDTPNPR